MKGPHWRRARKQHACVECCGAIPVGERYVYTAFGRWFDPMYLFRNARRAGVEQMKHHARCFARRYPQAFGMLEEA